MTPAAASVAAGLVLTAVQSVTKIVLHITAAENSNLRSIQ